MVEGQGASVVSSSQGKCTHAVAGYSNPLYADGDVLPNAPEAERPATGSTVARHTSGPSGPSLPFQTKLKRIQTAAAPQRPPTERRVSSTASPFAPNPCFPTLGPTLSCAPDAASLASSPTRSAAPEPVHDDLVDSGSVASIILDDCEVCVPDDGPNPIRPATPGASQPRTLMHVLSGAGEADSPMAAAAVAQGPAGEGDGDAVISRELDAMGPEGEMDGEATSGQSIAPSGCIPAPTATVLPEELRCSTPQHDVDLLSLLDDDMHGFVSRPGPLLKPFKCYIVREKAAGGLLKKAPHVYKLYYENTDSFLLSARRRTHTKTPSYVVSLHEFDVSRRNPDTYIGKIKSNFIGTEFQIYDRHERDATHRAPRPLGRHRSGGSSTAGDRRRTSSSADGEPASEATAATATSRTSCSGDDSLSRAELAVVQYHMNVMGTKGPRKMTIGIPYVDFDTHEASRWPVERTQDSMLSSLKKPGSDKMMKLVNKVPKWNSTLGAYCLNFNGRVTQASVKNFQLVSDGDEQQDRDILQFGRVADNKFTMDYCWPLTAYQAFCICITSLDNKLACE